MPRRSGQDLLSNFARIAGFLLPHKWRIAFALVALLVAAGCVLALGQGLKLVIDTGFSSGSPALLDQALAGMIGIAAVLAVATWFRFYLMMSTGERVVTDLRKGVFDHILGLDPAFFESERTGEVISRLTNDTTLVQQVIGFGGGENVDAPGVEGVQGMAAAGDHQRGAVLSAGFSQGERAVREVPGGEVLAAVERGAGFFPMEPAGDHQVEDHPEVGLQTDGDTLADAAKFDDAFAGAVCEGWIDGAEKKGTAEPHVLEDVSVDTVVEGFEVDDDVREFGHASND